MAFRIYVQVGVTLVNFLIIVAADLPAQIARNVGVGQLGYKPMTQRMKAGRPELVALRLLISLQKRSDRRGTPYENDTTHGNVPAQMEQLLKERIQDYRRLSGYFVSLVFTDALYATSQKHFQMQAGNSKRRLLRTSSRCESTAGVALS